MIPPEASVSTLFCRFCGVGSPGRVFRRRKSQLAHNLFDERHGCRQSRRFDPVEVDQPGHAVDFGALRAEIDGRFLGSANLRPDPGIARLRRAIPQLGPVGADRGIECIAARRIDRVINRSNPFDIRAKARLTCEIEGDVDAEPTRRRDR